MKTVWIIDEAGVWERLATRQIKFCEFFRKKGYKTLIISGSKMPKADQNLLAKKDKYKFQTLFGTDYLVVYQPNYKGNGLKRVLSAIVFQKNVMKVTKKMEKPDLVFLTYVGLFGNAFLKFKTRYKAQLFTDVLDLWPETFVDFGYIRRKGIIAKVLYKMEKKAYKTADYCIFSQEGGKDYILEKGWEKEIPLSKILYLNNGVDLEDVEKQQLANINPKFIHYKEDNYFKVVYLGSISEANNVELIVESAEEAQKRNLRTHFYIFGDGSCKDLLEKKCKEKHLNNIFFMGRTKQEEAQPILINADATILSFMNVGVLRFGSCNNKLFMYLAAGKPIISTVSPIYDIIKNNNCGIVVEPNKHSLIDGIIKIMSMPKDEYMQICNNCKTVIKEFDYFKMLEDKIYPLIKN